ncbi:Aldehyde dehydrogenase B [compost metagenome]
MDMLEPGKFGTAVPFKKRYGNYIGGEWVAPVENQYFGNITPVTGKVFCEVPRSSAADIDRALDAAHKAKGAWGRTSTTERANILNRIADRMQENLAMPRSTTKPSRTTFMNPSGWSARSFRGTSRSSWPCGSSRPRWRPATAWCSSPPSRRRCRSWC